MLVGRVGQHRPERYPKGAGRPPLDHFHGEDDRPQGRAFLGQQMEHTHDRRQHVKSAQHHQGPQRDDALFGLLQRKAREGDAGQHAGEVEQRQAGDDPVGQLPEVFHHMEGQNLNGSLRRPEQQDADEEGHERAVAGDILQLTP